MNLFLTSGVKYISKIFKGSCRISHISLYQEIAEYADINSVDHLRVFFQNKTDV